MSARHITLKLFLRRFPHPGFGAQVQSIWQSRSRARRLGLPDPYPFLYKQRGVRGLIVDLDKYDDWAYSTGRPTFKGGRA